MCEGSYIDPADTYRTVFGSLDYLGGLPVGHRGCSGALIPMEIRRHTRMDASGKERVWFCGYVCVPGCNLPKMDPRKVSAELSAMLSEEDLGKLPCDVSHYRRMPLPDGPGTGDHMDVFGICLAPDGVPMEDEGRHREDTEQALSKLSEALDLLEVHWVWRGLEDESVVDCDGNARVPLATDRHGGLLTVDCFALDSEAPHIYVTIEPRYLKAAGDQAA